MAINLPHESVVWSTYNKKLKVIDIISYSLHQLINKDQGCNWGSHFGVSFYFWGWDKFKKCFLVISTAISILCKSRAWCVMKGTLCTTVISHFIFQSCMNHEKQYCNYASVWSFISLSLTSWPFCKICMEESNLLVDSSRNVYFWNLDRSPSCDIEHLSCSICHWSFQWTPWRFHTY